ncbi:MAG: prephenate/arogenate dehydrogenase family protein [Pseudomonadota bacterium]
MSDPIEAREEPLFERMALIGIGLIGSSLSLAARRAGLVGEIVGTARSEATCQTALRLGLVDRVAATAGEAAQGADLVVLAGPVGIYGQLTEEMSSHLKPGAIVTDVGSVKAHVVEAAGPHIPEGVHFIPGHPIAGTEQSGPEAGFAELFDNRWTILTPVPGTSPEALAKLSAFWTGLGARIETMTPEHHDLVLAITSHVPHLIAYNIVGTAEDLADVTQSEVTKYSAGGFRDFTRIAASDPTMWRDIFLTNKTAVLEMLGRFVEDLSVLQRAIRDEDGERLFELFERTREIRKRIVEQGQETTAPDFGRRS